MALSTRSIVIGAVASAALTLSVTQSHAYLLAYEGFDYTPGGDISFANGGFGWTTPWGINQNNVTTSGNAVGDMALAGSLSYISGDRMLFTTGGRGFYSGISGTAQPFRDFFGNNGDAGTTVWMSFLAQRTGPTTNNTGSPFNPYPRAANVSLYDAGERLAIGNYSGAASNVWSLLPGGSGANSARSTNDFSLLSLAVLRIDYGATNDTAYLFINPALGLEPTLESAVATTNAANFNFFRVRPFAGGTDTGNSRPYAELHLDEIRIGTTWQDVTPFITIIPEPSIVSLGMLGGLVFWGFRRNRK